MLPICDKRCMQGQGVGGRRRLACSSASAGAVRDTDDFTNGAVIVRCDVGTGRFGARALRAAMKGADVAAADGCRGDGRLSVDVAAC